MDNGVLSVEAPMKARTERLPANSRISQQSQERPLNPDLEAPGDVPDTSAAHAQNDAGNKNIERHELLKYVLKAHLTVRAENLILGNVTSLRELASLDFRSLLALRNCGWKTAREIMTLIENLRESNPSLMPIPTKQEILSDLRARIHHKESISRETLKSALVLQPSKESLSLLPFFLDKRLPFLSEDDLHPGFKANALVACLFISVRSGNVLRQIGYERLGQILLTPHSEFLKQCNFERSSLRQLYDVVQDFVLNGPDSSYGSQVDYSSFSGMVRSLVTEVKLNKRDQEMILMWLLPEENNLVTHQMIADRHSLSRTRIEQIIYKGFRMLRLPTHAKRLRSFWNKAAEIVRSKGSTITLGELAKAIADEFQWDTSPHPASLKRFISKCGPEELMERLGIPKSNANQTPLISYL